MGLNEIYKIGNRIKKIRIEKGITQKRMAELTKIPYSTYSNYENNNRTPCMGQIKKIASILDVPVYELLGISPDESLDMNMNFPNLLIEENEDKIVIGFDQYPRTLQETSDSQKIVAYFSSNEYTPEELNDIKKYAEFLKSKRNTAPDPPREE